MQSFALLAETPTVLDPVIEELDLDISTTALANRLTVTVPLNSFLIEIRATSPDPEVAAEIADAVAAELAVAAERLSPSTRDSGAAAVSLENVAHAEVPSFAYAPNTRLEVTLWGAGGAAAGAIIALIWALTDTRIRREGDVESTAKIPVLAAVPKQRKSSRRGTSKLQVSEAFRRMRANLAFLDADHRFNVIVVTSPSVGEGKTTSSIALACALAETHSRVLLIDADLRKPTVASRTGLLAEAGLTNVLIGQATLDAVLQPWNQIDVLTSGPIPPNPAQLVESGAMKELIEMAGSHYNYVVIDSPPLLPVVDASVLARQVGGAVIVSRAGKTTRHQLSQAVQSLRTIDVEPLGSILVGTEQIESHYGSHTTGK